jgi:type VI secretion system protein ImpL
MQSGAGGNAGGAAASGQVVFQLQPNPTPGLVEYTVEIDGQAMRYRNGQQTWTTFTWPYTQGQPGARISAVTVDGRTVEIINLPGQSGLEKLFSNAARQRLNNGTIAMTWTGSGRSVSVNFKLISDSRAGSSASSNGSSDSGLRGMKLPSTVVGQEYAEQNNTTR